MPGDEVVVLPGVYTLGADELTVDDAIAVYGQPGAPRPMIVSAAALALEVSDPGAAVSDLGIEHLGDTTFRTIRLFAGLVERVYVKAEDPRIACESAGDAPGEAMIRDSVCWLLGTDGAAAGTLNAGISSPPRYGTFVNVTAVGRRMGIQARADSESDAAVTARNVIADATDGSVISTLGGDVRATTEDAPSPGDSATVTLANSNYVGAVMLGAGASVTPAGSGSNQTATPLLVDPVGGDFHQLVGSPTIDAGSPAGPLGNLDIDREARIQGPAPDIGADEGAIAPPPSGGPPPSGRPPAAGPSSEFSFGKMKRNRKRGIAKLIVQVPGPGTLHLAKNRKVKPQQKRAEAAGPVKLPVKPRRRAKKKLNEKGRVKVRAEVTFTPDGGEPNTESKRLKLNKAKR
jgi:hypothetical protein